MVKGILLDLGGVVFVGDDPLPGAIDAVAALRARGIAIRFITNTTRQPRAELLAKMRRMGLAAAADELFMPAIAARRYLDERKLTPYLLVHPALVRDFPPHRSAEPNAVVVGDAGEVLSYAALNMAFRLLNNGAEFLALATNRSFRDADGELSLDAGPFVAALEYASGRKASVFGKPAAAFFHEAIASLGLPPADVAMIGDDVEHDVGAAMALGMTGILVRTGKYQAGDETKISPPPTAVAVDLAEAAQWIMRVNS